MKCIDYFIIVCFLCKINRNICVNADYIIWFNGRIWGLSVSIKCCTHSQPVFILCYMKFIMWTSTMRTSLKQSLNIEESSVNKELHYNESKYCSINKDYGMMYMKFFKDLWLGLSVKVKLV